MYVKKVIANEWRKLHEGIHNEGVGEYFGVKV